MKKLWILLVVAMMAMPMYAGAQQLQASVEGYACCLAPDYYLVDGDNAARYINGSLMTQCAYGDASFTHAADIYAYVRIEYYGGYVEYADAIASYGGNEISLICTPGEDYQHGTCGASGTGIGFDVTVDSAAPWTSNAGLYEAEAYVKVYW